MGFGIRSLDQAILDVTEALGKHKNCKHAWWVPTRTSFKVTRKDDGRSFEIVMSASIGRKSLQKIRTHMEQDVNTAEERAVAGIMAVIEKAHGFCNHKSSAELLDEEKSS